MSAFDATKGWSIVYVQKHAIPEQFYFASERVADMTPHIPCSIHTVHPPFSEREKKARDDKWFMYKSQALLYPRMPADLAPWIMFADKEDGGQTLAQLVWGGRLRYPRLCYKLWGRATKARDDILHRTNGEFLIRPRVLMTLYPQRSYRRERLTELPELSLEHFKEWEIKSLTAYVNDAEDSFENRG